MGMYVVHVCDMVCAPCVFHVQNNIYDVLYKKGYLTTCNTDAMDKKGPFFFGEEISIVDIMWAPWVIRFSSVIKKYRDFVLPTAADAR